LFVCYSLFKFQNFFFVEVFWNLFDHWVADLLAGESG
jgi:hypothetical protein